MSNQRYIGITELAQDVVDMITNIAEGPVNFYATTGDFPVTGFIEKLYISLNDNAMYIWDGTTYNMLSGGGEGTVANIFEYTNVAGFPTTGEIQKVYIDKEFNEIYRWGGSAYVRIGGITRVATTSANGLMSSSDKIKLDGLGGVVTTTENGLMAYADKVKLNGVAANANNYTHPTTDGNKHLPVNGTTNNGKYLKAGATAGVSTWSAINASEIVATGGTNVQAKLDSVAYDVRTSSTELILEKRTVDPVSPTPGRIWLRSDL